MLDTEMQRRVGYITADDLLKRLDRGDDLQLIDVREVEELEETGVIPGIKHIPMYEVEAKIGEVDLGKETIVICRSGRRSQGVCYLLHTLGHHHVKTMTGGMKDWKGKREVFTPA
jgi:rhodanese-related sulfurtransferase